MSIKHKHMTDTKPDIKYANPTNPLLDGLPEFLKEPKNYMKVQKALLDTLSCGKLHSDPLKMMECSKCTENMITRKKLMEKFGFGKEDDVLTLKRYMEWKKIHEEIKRRMPLDKYNHMVGIK